MKKKYKKVKEFWKEKKVKEFWKMLIKEYHLWVIWSIRVIYSGLKLTRENWFNQIPKCITFINRLEMNTNQISTMCTTSMFSKTYIPWVTNLQIAILAIPVQLPDFNLYWHRASFLHKKQSPLQQLLLAATFISSSKPQ